MMHGPEASILAVSDGFNVYCFPAAQDHKRAFDGDKVKSIGKKEGVLISRTAFAAKWRTQI